MPLGDFREVFLPYCLDRQTDGRYAVLNREYKPVGFFTREHVEYEQHPVLVVLKGLTARKAALLSWDGSSDLNRIFLYAPAQIRTGRGWVAYMERLTLLAKLRVSEPPRPRRRLPQSR